jgi:aldehyde:ferredoxin oxidoreductase
MLLDCLGVCFIPVVAADVFGDPLILFKELGEIYRAATGLDPAGLFEATERAYQLEKCFNALLGMSRKDDLRSGTRRGEEDPIHHPGMLDEYYRYRGCSQDGLPTGKRLHEVGLDAEAEALAQSGCLGRGDCPNIQELAPPQC